MVRSRSLPIFCLLPCLASAAPVVLTLEPGASFDLTYALDTGQGATTNVELSGFIEADVELTDAEPIRVRFTGGRILHSDEDMTVQNVAGGNVEILTRGIAAGFESDTGAGALTSRSALINQGHWQNYNQGTITTRYVLDIRFVGRVVVGEEVRELSTSPDRLPLVGTTSVTATLLEAGPLLSRHRIDLQHIRDETRSQPVGAEITSLTGATRLDISEVGSFTASGEMLAPSEAFATWASTTRGVVPGSADEFDPATGQPLAVLYAMDAPAGSWTPPVTFDPSASEARLMLPPSGTRALLRCEYSATLDPDSWIPLGSVAFPEGEIPLGTAGEIALPLPRGPRGFLRLAAGNEPEP